VERERSQEADILWLAYAESIEEDFQMLSQLKRAYPHLDIRYVPLNFNTRGAAETLYIVTQAMTAEEKAKVTVSLDCDTLYFRDVLKDVRSLQSKENGIVFFRDETEKPIFSYIELDSDSKVVAIREKVKIR